ncbi:MAG: DUF1559 domain-containing protein [Patescibacteria group bacterium]|nr:DUF1559 domain-containing protein [Patescibacteria group bacterium]
MFVSASHGSRRPLWISAAIVFVLLAATTYVNLAPSRPMRISREITYITEPLKSDGMQVDYFTALQQATYPPDIATENNGFRLLVQHLGPRPRTTPEEFDDLCAQLGLDAKSIRPEMTYQDPREYLESHVTGPAFDKAWLDKVWLDEWPADNRTNDSIVTLLRDELDRPWTLDALPMMARWIEENGPALDLVGRAVSKPTFHIPMVRRSEDLLLVEHSLGEVERLRWLAHGLNARANHRIAGGHIDLAIDDIVACKRLGRHIGHGATGLDLSTGLVFEGISHAIGIAGSLEHAPSREQLQRLIHELDGLPAMAEMDHAILSDRFMWLDCIQSLSHGKAAWTDVWEIPEQFARFGIDWNIIAGRFNKAFDEALATGCTPDWPEFTTPVALRCFFIRARSTYVADRWLSCSLSSLLSLPRFRQRTVCSDQMRRIVLAMLLYERDHGTLPTAYSVDAAGNPLHSWRVLLLPYLGHEALYKRIRLDEPWDSEHNRQFHGQDMAIYRCPCCEVAGPGQATYSVVAGPNMPFEAGQGKRLADFGPMSDDMILVVERIDPVDWMVPTGEMTQAVVEKWTEWHAAPSMMDTTGPIGAMGMEGTTGSMGPRTPQPPAVFGENCYSGGANFALRNGAAVYLKTTEARLGAMLRGTNTDKSSER